jgi:D-sedoheptulose 7-phosphate isomerase
MSDLIQKKLLEGIAVLEAVVADSALHDCLMKAAEKTASALKDGRKLMVAGNGGSAADAQHLVAEFVSRLCEDRPAMRAVALTTDTSILTAVGNDYGYERVFARQIEALGQSADVFMGISTSGNSSSVLRALELSREMGITTIGLCGRADGKMAPLCDYCIRVPSDVTMYIQQAHLALEHIFCMMVERSYF